MLVMIFVNQLADVKGLPAWTYHMPAHIDAMTYVDMVFPAFLFAMGLSLPLSLRSRLAKGASLANLWLHILIRTICLTALGLILANAEAANRGLMPLHLTGNAWALIALLGAALFLNVYPKSVSPLWPTLSKAVGLLLVVLMLLIFRRSDGHGHPLWLDFSYWEILGIIGWTYLAVCILYIPTRRWRLAPVLWLIVLCAFNLLSAAHLIRFSDVLPLQIWPWSNGAFCILTMAGVVTADLLLSGTPKLRQSLLFGLAMLVAGALSSPLGISKIRATPTWCLVSAGTSVLIFLALYCICDLQRHTRWAAFVHPAGANTLLTYLLPDFFFFGVSTAWLPAMWRSGLPGVFQTAVFTALMLLLAALLTRWRVRLQL
jgi:predicted acyltransferase